MWEARYGLNLAINDRYLTPAGNGVTVLQAYINGTDPNDYYQGVVPVISTVTGSDGQMDLQGFVSVQVGSANGSVLSNAPVTIAVTTGASQLLATSGGSPATSPLQIRTDSQGGANFYLSFSTYKPETIVVTGGGISHSITIQPPLTDSGGNGLPDLWEITYFGQTGVDHNVDSDGDGITNLQEFQKGTDPSDYYNGVLPQLTSQVPGDGRLASDGSIGLIVTDSVGHFLANAPVFFAVKQGGHHLSATLGGSPVDQLTVRSDANGLARIYIFPGN